MKTCYCTRSDRRTMRTRRNHHTAGALGVAQDAAERLSSTGGRENPASHRVDIVLAGMQGWGPAGHRLDMPRPPIAGSVLPHGKAVLSATKAQWQHNAKAGSSAVETQGKCSGNAGQRQCLMTTRQRQCLRPRKQWECNAKAMSYREGHHPEVLVRCVALP